MKITIVGRGGVGGGLARFFEAAGYEVTALSRDGGTRAHSRTSWSA
jgi:predicted dinucleotide-binding enzyme